MSQPPGGRRITPAGPARLGRGQGYDGPAHCPAPREGLAPTGGGCSPEGLAGTGAQRQRRASEQKPRERQRAPTATASRSRSVFSNRLVLTRPRLLPLPGNQGPSSAAPRSRDPGPQPRAAGEEGLRGPQAPPLGGGGLSRKPLSLGNARKNCARL